MASARALVALAVSVLALGLVPGAFAGQQSFTVPGTYEFTVPDGVTSLDVVAVGASGGNGSDHAGGQGGLGALVQGTLAVTPGETLQVNVGGQGAVGSVFGGGGGGGASDIRTGAFTLDDRVVVAGGGGGGGGIYWLLPAGSGAGGAGGGGAGGDCLEGVISGGGGGTQDAGGAGGTPGGAAAGSFGQGGKGAGELDAPGGFNGGGDSGFNGGGGGGGWYGGGGGGGIACGAGGGGGSNHAGPQVTAFLEGLADGPGDGSVTLTWDDPTAPVLQALSPASGPAGTPVTITGQGLAHATDVLFGNVEASFTILSDTQILTAAPAQPPVFSGAARAAQGLASSSVPVVVIGPGGTSNPLTYTYASSVIDVPTPCDPLTQPCGGQDSAPPGTPPLAPTEGGGDGPAVGRPRMPNLTPTLTATWRDGILRITIRVHIFKPRLVKSPIQVRVRIPALGQTRLLTIRANGKHLRTLRLAIPSPASVIGKRVIVRLDPNKHILETRRNDNTTSARIT